MRGRTANSLQVQLARSGVPGSSSASVSRYVHGTVELPVRFLQAAARELDVSELWLISGYGAPDRDGAPAQSAGSAEREESSSRGERVSRRIENRFHPFAAMREAPRAVVRDLCLRMADGEVGGASDLECADRVGTVLQAPLELLGLGGEGAALDRERVEAYAIATAQALAWLLPEREDGPRDVSRTGGKRRRRTTDGGAAP